MSGLTDADITALCAKAQFVGRRLISMIGSIAYVEPYDSKEVIRFDPLHDDVQCFALVKKFPAECVQAMQQEYVARVECENKSPDFNRCVCLCVAQMQLAKGGG